MPLQITHRNESEVPSAAGNGKVNEDLQELKSQMTKLSGGMVLQIETESNRGVRGTKMLVTKAAKELGSEWRHWNNGTIVYAKPVDGAKRRGRKKAAA